MDDVISPGLAPAFIGTVWTGEVKPTFDVGQVTCDPNAWTRINVNNINGGCCIPYPTVNPYDGWFPTTTIVTTTPLASKFRSTITGDKFTLSIDVPGAKKGTLEVTIDEGMYLRIRGTRADTNAVIDEKQLVFGDWDLDPERIDAVHEDGVLTVTFQKKAKQTCKIRVK